MAKFDINKHHLVPKHQKISKKEAQELLAKYNITPKELPKISKKDPVLKSLDVQSGDIIKITRKSPTVVETVFYRGVSDE